MRVEHSDGTKGMVLVVLVELVWLGTGSRALSLWGSPATTTTTTTTTRLWRMLVLLSLLLLWVDIPYNPGVLIGVAASEQRQNSNNGNRAQRDLVPATRVSCIDQKPKEADSDGVPCLTLKNSTDGKSLAHMCLDKNKNRSLASHPHLGTYFLLVHQANSLGIDLFIVHCSCAGGDSQEGCARHKLQSINFFCKYTYPSVSSESFNLTANVSDVNVTPAVCCQVGSCLERSLRNATFDQQKGDDDDDGGNYGVITALSVMLGVVLMSLVITLLAGVYWWRKYRRLLENHQETGRAEDEEEGQPMN